MLGFLGSIFSGGVTGLLGVAFQRFFDFLKIKQELEMKKAEFGHEANMKRIDGELMAQEWAARTQVAEVEAEGKRAKAAEESFSQSFALEPKQYSAKATISPVASFMLVTLDFIRGMVRPGLTVYLCVITTMMYLEAKVIIAGASTLISADQAITVYNIIVTTVLYLTTTCVLWWFGTRNSQKPPRGNK